MTKKVIKLVSIGLAGLLVIYLGFQIYYIAYPAYRVEVATISAVEDSVFTTGIVVRDEMVFEGYTGDGVCHYLVASGEKVGKGSTVAEIYASPQDALDCLTLEILREELALLKQIADGSRTVGSRPSAIEDRINRLLAEVTLGQKRIQENQLTAWRIQLLDLLTSYTLARGGEVDAASHIGELETQIALLAARKITPIRIIQAPMDGYFVSGVDGLESRINKTTTLSMPAAEMGEIIQSGEMLSDGYKIVSDYSWYYAMIMNESDAAKFKSLPEGATLSLDFGYAGITGLPVTVAAVTSDEALGKAKVVLECTRFDTALTGRRLESGKITFSSDKGIIVKRSALRVENGQLGVYIKYTNSIAFRTVESIAKYETDDYIISRIDDTNSDRLALHDEMIVSGKDLYVGKKLG